MTALYEAIVGNPVCQGILYFFATYPIFSCLVWVTTSLIYYLRREHADDGDFYRIDEHPLVSILIPAYCEERNIAGTVEHALRLNYPRGEIVVIIDADARVHPDFLKYIIPHFVRLSRLAGITGNPRVVNTGRMIAKIQAVEFSSIVAILRRAQTVWRRILTVSGVVSTFRKSALLDVDLFDPDMATEDIALSWKLQKRFYDVRYEPRAVADMEVPDTIGGLWRQRRRWAKGLAQVLKKILMSGATTATVACGQFTPRRHCRSSGLTA